MNTRGRTVFCAAVTIVAMTVLAPMDVMTQHGTAPRLVNTTYIGEGVTASRVNSAGEILLTRWGTAYLWSSDLGVEEIRLTGDIYVTIARNLNNQGDVVGEVLSHRGYYEPFIWSREAGIQLLSPDPDMVVEVSPPSAVNDAREVVGSDNLAFPAYRWSPTTGFERGNPLGGSAGGCTSSALDISRWGESVGASTIDEPGCDESEGLPPMHAYFQRRSGHTTDLGTLGGIFSVGVAVNDSGQAAGWSRTANGSQRAFVWSAADGLQNLGTLGGGWSRATALNNLGQVVGLSETATSSIHGFVWSAATGMLDIGPGVPTAINDLGQVVGTVTTSGSSTAWMWSAVDARSTIAHDAKVADINDRGQAVGETLSLTPPVVATLWQLRVTPAETLNWYEAQIRVGRYGGVMKTSDAATGTAWVGNARRALSRGDTKGLASWLSKLRTRLGEP